MNCLYCQATVQDRDKFCRKCGAAIAPGSTAYASSAQTPSIEDQQVPSDGKESLPWWATLTTVVLLVCLAVYVYRYIRADMMTLGSLSLTDGPGKQSASFNGSGKPEESHARYTGPSLRIYQPGDVWDYSITATIKKSDGTTLTGNGMMEETISQGTLGGSQVLVDDQGFGIPVSDGTRWGADRKTYFTQDSNGDYQELGEVDNDGPMLSVTNPQTTIPGYWQNAPSLNANLNFSDGSTRNISLNTTFGSTMQVSLLGQMAECWTFELTGQGPGDLSSDTKGLFCPALGQMVRGTDTLTNSDGGTVTLDIVLTGSSLAPSAYGNG